MLNRSLVVLAVLFTADLFAVESAVQNNVLAESIGRLRSHPGSALQALAEIGTPSHVAVPAVLRVMPDGEDASFFNYFSIVGAAAVPALERELQSPERAVRRNAARALGLTLTRDKDHTALNVLGAALEHGDADVRKFAARSLSFSGRAGEHSPALRKLLASSDIDERLAAATTLIATLLSANEEIVAAIQADFPRGSPLFRQEFLSTFVRSDVRIDARTALPFLRVALKDPNFSYEALIGFEKLGPLAHPAILEIEPRLRSDSLTDRYYAVTALQAIRQDRPNLDQHAKRVFKAMVRGDLLGQAPFLARNFKHYEGQDEMLKAEAERLDDGADFNAQHIIGTADYAIVSRGGFAMEFVREAGAWKLLYIYFRMC